MVQHTEIDEHFLKYKKKDALFRETELNSTSSLHIYGNGSYDTNEKIMMQCHMDLHNSMQHTGLHNVYDSVT